jgi:hypothetical protein
MGFVLSSINEKKQTNHTNWRPLLSSESRLLAFFSGTYSVLCLFFCPFYLQQSHPPERSTLQTLIDHSSTFSKSYTEAMNID